MTWEEFFSHKKLYLQATPIESPIQENVAPTDKDNEQNAQDDNF